MPGRTVGLVWRAGPLLGKGSDPYRVLSGWIKFDSVRVADDPFGVDSEECGIAVGKKTHRTIAIAA